MFWNLHWVYFWLGPKEGGIWGWWVGSVWPSCLLSPTSEAFLLMAFPCPSTVQVNLPILSLMTPPFVSLLKASSLWTCVPIQKAHECDLGAHHLTVRVPTLVCKGQDTVYPIAGRAWNWKSVKLEKYGLWPSSTIYSLCDLEQVIKILRVSSCAKGG